mmetsp:Transcript_45448/g.176741  ORF Transcript_45448/g.176741 Transcript_45448/m.176741 type:complete len:215 (+) Transcript_45448:150-794(+)
MGSILQDEVEGLLQSQRYDPSIIPKLEEYVQHQVTIGPYDSDANLALLKLYQFYPELYNAGVVAKVLMLALTALPATDFLCSQYLISSKFQNQEPVPKLVNLLELLEGGKYLEFWASKESYKDRIPAVKDFDKSIRRFMFGVIKRTYIAIEREEFMGLLNLKDEEMAGFIRDEQLTEADGTIKLPPTNENQPKPVKVTEAISFREVAPTLFKVM